MARPKPRRTSPLYLPSAFDLFKPSRDAFLKYFGVFGTLYILPLIFWLHSWISTPAHGGFYFNRTTDTGYGGTIPTSYSASFIGFTIIWTVFALVANSIVQIMLQKSQLDVSQDKEPSIERSWQTFKTMWWPLVKLYAAMIGIILLGFIVFIIPGFFMIRRYFFAPYVMLDKKCGVKQALQESHKLGLINTGSVWGVLGVIFLIAVMGVVPVIGSLASFIFGALYSIAPALRYQQLKKLAS